MLGDGVCQTQCNNQACQWDLLDCGCAPGCNVPDYGRCKAECLVPDCAYDQMSSQCPQQFLSIAALNYHLVQANFSLRYSYASTCLQPLCTPAELLKAQTSCSQTCNDVGCGLSYGNCAAPSPCTAPNLCEDCGSIQPSGCLQCQAGAYHFYLSCLAACPSAFHVHPLVAFLCVPDPDLSSVSSPVLFYVSADLGVEGMGTQGSPFRSLAVALQGCVFRFCLIHILPGTHTVAPNPTSFHLTALGQNPTSVPKGSFNVTISGLICADCSPPVLLFDNQQPVQFHISGGLTFTDVLLNGNSSLLPNCQTEKCSYCSAITVGSGGQGVDDQGVTYSAGSFATTDLCQRFRPYSLFFMRPKSSLSFLNSAISNFRQGYGYLISLTSGWLTLHNSHLTNISTNPVADLSTMYLSTMAAIQQNSTNSPSEFTAAVSYEEGAILLDSVNVTLWNNGYELSTKLVQSGLLYINGIRDIRILNSTFSHNIVQKGSFLVIINYVKFEMRSCTFSSIYLDYYLLKLSGAGLMTLGPNGEIDQFTMSHVTISEVNITGVAVISRDSYFGTGLFYFNNNGFGHNYLLEKVKIAQCTIGFAILSVRMTTNLSGRDQLGVIERYTTVSGLRITVQIPQICFILANLSISDTTFYLELVNLLFVANVIVRNVEISNCGDGITKIGQYTFANMIGKFGVYLRNLPLESTWICSTFLNFNTIYTFNVTNTSLNRCSCSSPNAPAAFQVTSSGNGYIKNLTLAKLTGSSTSASAMAISTTGEVQLIEVKFMECRAIGQIGVVSLVAAQGITLRMGYFGDNQANSAVLRVSGSSYLSVLDSYFTGNTAATQTCLSFTPATGLISTPVLITSSVFQGNKGADGVALHFTDSVTNSVAIQLQISACKFINNVGTGIGTAVLIDNKIQLSPNSWVRSSIFSGNRVKEGILHLTFFSGTFRVESCRFSGNEGGTVSAISASLRPGSAEKEVFLGVFDCLFEGNVGKALVKMGNPNGYQILKSARNRFLANNRRIFEIDKTNLTDINSVYDNNGGSAIHCTTKTIVNSTNAIFTNGTDSIGGAVYLGGGSAMTCSNCSFYKNSATTHGGALYIEQASTITCRDCVFLGNTAGGKGSAVYLFGSPVNSSFRNASFEGHYSGDSATVAAISSSIRFLNASFTRNKALRIAGLTAYFSNFSLTNVTFTDHRGLSSPLIYSAIESVFSMKGCQVSGLEASSIGGLIFALSSILYIDTSVFDDLKAASGALLQATSGSIFVISNITVSNVQSGKGAITTIGGYGSVSNAHFSDFSVGAFHASSMVKLELSHVTFSSNFHNRWERGYGWSDLLHIMHYYNHIKLCVFRPYSFKRSRCLSNRHFPSFQPGLLPVLQILKSLRHFNWCNCAR